MRTVIQQQSPFFIAQKHSQLTAHRLVYFSGGISFNAAFNISVIDNICFQNIAYSNRMSGNGQIFTGLQALELLQVFGTELLLCIDNGIFT